MVFPRLRTAIPLAGLALLAACGNRRTVVVTERSERLVEIEIEVYDPQTNFVWEGVGVRILEGFHEWSGCVCANPDPDRWFFTDETGRVLLTSIDLVDADIGFLEDEYGRAVISPDVREDEAFVLVELDALGFDPVQVDIPITWRRPAVFVEIPFEPRTTLTAGGEGGPAFAVRLRPRPAP